MAAGRKTALLRAMTLMMSMMQMMTFETKWTAAK
jgi:hypothetical protein